MIHRTFRLPAITSPRSPLDGIIHATSKETAMARVRSIPSAELTRELAATYEAFAAGYGPFRNQVAVFAHVPAALRHLMAMLMELREAATLPKRLLELAIVTVSKLNK